MSYKSNPYYPNNVYNLDTFNNIPNDIERLILSHGEIEGLRFHKLHKFTNLIELDLTDNKISHISSENNDTLNKLSKLTYISLELNKLESVDLDLEHLIKLNLSYNPLNQLHIKGDKIQTLNLSKTNLIYLSSLNTLTNLKTLYLHENDRTNSKGTYLPNLLELNAENLFLTNLDNFTRLTRLIIGYLPEIELLKMSRLSYLELHFQLNQSSNLMNSPLTQLKGICPKELSILSHKTIKRLLLTDCQNLTNIGVLNLELEVLKLQDLCKHKFINLKRLTNLDYLVLHSADELYVELPYSLLRADFKNIVPINSNNIISLQIEHSFVNMQLYPHIRRLSVRGINVQLNGIEYCSLLEQMESNPSSGINRGEIKKIITRNKKLRWERIHRLLLEISIIFYSKFPPYVLLEIIDWVPNIFYVNHYKKIQLINNVIVSINKIRRVEPLH